MSEKGSKETVRGAINVLNVDVSSDYVVIHLQKLIEQCNKINTFNVLYLSISIKIKCVCFTQYE